MPDPGAADRPGAAARPDDSAAAAVSVVVGEEELLVERAVGRLTGAARSARAEPDIREVQASALAAGDLASLTAPSLFGGEPVVVVWDAQDAAKGAADDLAAFAASPPPDAALIVTHAGGAKGRTLLSALVASAGRVVDCPKITRVAERAAFVRAEFRSLGRSADDSGVRALLDALGGDLREIASACSQLAADTTGVIDQRVVATYYRGRAEATGFAVADRAVEGRVGDALELLRWALATGVPPVLITSALAQSVRLLGRVSGAPGGRPDAALAGEVGCPPWKIDVVRRQLRGWAPVGIARALAAVAAADAQVKGEGASPGYALEEAVRAVAACRGGR